MKKVIFPALIFFATSCLAQSGAQASGSANTGAAASPGQSSVQVEGNANASASGQRSGQNGGAVHQDGSGSGSGSMSTPGAGNLSGMAGLAAGSTISAVLSKPVDARKNKDGDPVVAKTTQNVKSSGETIIPKGSRLLGHVTQAHPRAKGESDSELGIIFDQAVLKNGQQVALHTVIQAIGSSQSAASSNGTDAMADVGSAAQISRPTAAGNNSGGNSGGGLLGGVGSTVGAVANTTGNLAGSAAGSVNNTVGGTVNAAGAAGNLTSSSGGVFGLSGLTLNSVASNATQGSIISSTGHNVHLDSGTQLILRVVQ